MIFKQVGFGAGNGFDIVRKVFGQIGLLIYAMLFFRV
jgi:hypothetical protein